MALQGADKVKFDKVVKNAESHMAWVEQVLQDPASNDGAVAVEAKQRTAAAQVWATLANAYAQQGQTPKRLGG